MRDWHPIETAPKDGRRVLFFIPSRAAGTNPYRIGWWIREHTTHAGTRIGGGYWGPFSKRLKPKFWAALNYPEGVTR